MKYFPDCYSYDEDESNRILSVALQTRECQQVRENHFLRILMKGGGNGGLTAEIVQTLLERIEVYPGQRVKVVFAFEQSEVFSGGESG